MIIIVVVIALTTNDNKKKIKYHLSKRRAKILAEKTSLDVEQGKQKLVIKNELSILHPREVWRQKLLDDNVHHCLLQLLRNIKVEAVD